MKIMKYSWLAACVLLLASCQNDTLKQELQQKGTIYSIKGQMNNGNAMSRAQIELNNPNSGEEIFFWNEGDQFDLHQYYKEELTSGDPEEFHSTVFTISNDYNASEDATSAVFQTNKPAYSTIDYVAVYPAGKEIDYYKVEFTFQKDLDFTNATTEAAQAAVWQDYFKNNMFMVASGNFDEPDHVVTFNHVCGLFRVTYTNKTSSEQTIDGIQFGGDQNFHNAYEQSLGSGPVGGGTNYYESPTLNTKGLKVAAGESTDLYLFFFPIAYNQDGDLEITILREGVTAPLMVEIPISEIRAFNGNPTQWEAGKRYWFKVTETADGLIWSKEETVTIPNPGFSIALQEYLGDEVVTIDATTGYAIMKKSDINNVKELNFKASTFDSLEGIDLFVNLEKLVCTDNANLESLDLSKNTALTSIDVTRCSSLSTLNISGLKKLTELNYNETAVAGLSIDTEAIPNIELLYFGRLGDGPAIYVPDVNSFTSLNTLACYGQTFTLTNEDIKAQLTDLQCYNCGLSELDLSEYPNLVTLACYKNSLTELLIPENAKIGSLNCHTNQLTTLDITPLSNTLYDLYCGCQSSNGESITMTLTLTESQKDKWNEQDTGWYAAGWGLNENVKLSVDSGNTDGTVVIGNADLSAALLEVLGAEKVTINESGHAIMSQEDVNDITSLDFGWDCKTDITTLNGIENFKNLEVLYCQGKQNLTSCDLSKNTALRILDLQQSWNLTSLDLSANTALEELAVTYSQIESLNLSKNTQLDYLAAYSNRQLTSLDVSTCSKLQTLILWSCSELASINLANPASILTLEYENTKLTFDLSVFTGLKSLNCENKPDDFATLTSTQKSNLTSLLCRMCGLTEIDLREYPNLTTLNCSGNALTSLDVSMCKNLESLYCSYNRMTTLDLSMLTNLSDVICGRQTDQNGNELQLTLKLDSSLESQWNSEWANYDDNYNVVLSSGVETGNGNTGGEDFRTEGIW